jgi:hypothetical protein
MEEELDAIEKIFKRCGIDYVSKKNLFNSGLGFRADFSDPETVSLQKKYIKCHKELTKSYQNTTFLEKTLELIYLANQL